MQNAEQKKYHLIHLVNTTNMDKLYVGIKEDGSVVLFDKFVSDVSTFETYQAAQAFVVKHGLDSKPNINFYIKDNQELMREGVSSKPKEPLWTVENGAGWKLFWSETKKEYYWDNKPLGHIAAHQAWIDDWEPRLKKKYPNMEIKFVPIEKAQMVKL